MADQNWDATFQAIPIGTDLISEGDNRILDLKQTTRSEFKVEHDVGEATVDGDYTDTGRHISGSARAFFHDSGTWTPAGLLAPSNAGAWPPGLGQVQLDRLGSFVLDNGRLWIDIADIQPYVREQEQTAAAWSDLNANEGANAASWLSLWPRTYSSLDDATTADQTIAGADTWTAVTGLTLTITPPDDGRVYEILTTVHLRWASPDSADKNAARLLEDDGASNTRDVVVFRASSNNYVGDITLAWLKSSATGGTAYAYTVEVCCSDAGSLVVNPNQASGEFNDTIGGLLAGGDVAVASRMICTLRPQYTTY